MKSIIAGLIIFLVYIAGIIFLPGIGYDSNNYAFALKCFEKTDQKLDYSTEFLSPLIKIKTRDELLSIIKKDNRANRDSYRDFGDKSQVLYKNIIFYFDSLGNFRQIRFANIYRYSEFQVNDDTYPPIISYLFQSTSNLKLYWGNLHYYWIIFVFALSVLIIFNLTLAILKKRNHYLISTIILTSLALVINMIHFAVYYQYNLSRTTEHEPDLNFYSPVVYLKIMGMMSEFNALNFDVSIIFLIIIFISAFYLRKLLRTEI